MTQLVFIENNRPLTDSLNIAETFEKEHRRVMQDIRELGCSEEFRKHHFVQSSYINSQNKEIPKYLITQDGFTLLAMGYTGQKAMEFKEKYISEFNRMREKLSKPPQTQLEILQASIGQLVEQERRITTIEEDQRKIKDNQNNIVEILSLNPTEWRKKVNALITKIANARGGFNAFQDVRNESYKRLEERAKCSLPIRLTNKKQKMALEGVPKSKIDKFNRMDVIADDARLTEIYLAIVKEMAIQYQVSA